MESYNNNKQLDTHKHEDDLLFFIQKVTEKGFISKLEDKISSKVNINYKKNAKIIIPIDPRQKRTTKEKLKFLKTW